MSTFFIPRHLDSVDEARLVSHDHFKRALKRISAALGEAAKRAFVYISGRGSDWSAVSDLSMVEEWLPIPPEPNIKENNEADVGEQSLPSQKKEAPDAAPPIRVFRLAPLTQEQVQLFAQNCGVTDAGNFFKAIERADAGIFAARPRDLIDLIAYWQQFDKIASLAEMTEYNIQKKLTETNPKHCKKDPLSPEKARGGAEIIAAALTFSRRNFIALPDPKSLFTPSGHLLDAKAILVNWTSEEVESLLRRALFDEATYGRVKIHHRSVREYLTAQWLHKLLQHGKSRRSIEQLIFAERYGLKVVTPSMKEVSAWLALWDEKICQRMCDIAPEILIGHGDPSQLSIPVRERLLRQFAVIRPSNSFYDESLDISAIRRLADSRLAKTIIQLLEENRSNEEVRHLLLRTIWQGEIKECAEIALSFALDSFMDRYTRLGGIRAIGVCGTSNQQHDLAEAILAEAATGDVELTSAVCEQFFPRVITVDALLETLEKIPKPKRFSVNRMSHTLEQIVEKCPESQDLLLLTGFVRLLELKPHISEHFCEISQEYAWLIPHAANLAYGLLTNSIPCIDDVVLRTVELVAESTHYRSEIHHSGKIDFRTIIGGVPELRHLFFWRTVKRVRECRKEKISRLDDWRYVRFRPVPWKIDSEDFAYFLAQAGSLPDLDNRLVAFSVALSIWNDSGNDQPRLEEINALARNNAEMAAKLDIYLNPPPPSLEELEHQLEMEELKREQDKREQQEKADSQKWIRRLQVTPKKLREISSEMIDTKFSDLYWLAERIREHKDEGGSKWGVNKWEALIDEFGLDVAEAARDGLMAYWRLYCPEFKSEQDTNGIPNGLIVGMVGLAIEARTKPDWMRHLSHEEALLAGRYATHEMNGFPTWIEDLQAFHPQALDEILQKELLWEFEVCDGGHSTPIHHMLAQLRYTNLESLREHYCPYIFQLLQNKEPWSDQTLENALSLILQWDGLDTCAFTELAKQRHSAANEENRLLTWLVAWLCVDAEGAQGALCLWLSMAKGKIKKKERIIRFCGAMGDHHFKRFGSKYRDFERIEFLESFVPLIYQHIRREDDEIHEGVYTPNDRDNAEGIRGYLLNKVCDTPGRQAFNTLIKFSKALPHKLSRERMQIIALRRAAADAEFSPWEVTDVIDFAQRGEKTPVTDRELFDLVCSRLDDIKYDLEEGDTSIAATLQKVDYETELRVWFSDSLRKAARGKYSIAPEEELADAKRPDIRVHEQKIDTPCVIELKISDNWSFRKHIERLHKQLVGQYLRDVRSRFGVYLLVRRHQKYWVSDQRLSFEALVTHVQSEADQIIQGRSDLEAIKVVGINLMKRHM